MRIGTLQSTWLPLLLTVMLAVTAVAEEKLFQWIPEPDHIETALNPNCENVTAANCVDAESPVQNSCLDANCSTCDWLSNACCCPTWKVQAGAVFLRRDKQDNLLLTNGAESNSVHDLALDEYQAGLQVSLMRQHIFGSATTLEVSYFGVRNEATAVSSATAFYSTPTINFGARDVTMDYFSRLDSTEINLRRACNDWLTVLAGFRWVELSDELATDFGPAASHNVNVNNHLYGGQLGAEVLILCRDRLSFQWLGKAGISDNRADQDTTTVGVGGAIPALAAQASQVGFLGEMALLARYEINDCWSIQGGYQALWLDGIALAPNQLAASSIVTGTATLDNSSAPLYHGFLFTVQAVW